MYVALPRQQVALWALAPKVPSLRRLPSSEGQIRKSERVLRAQNKRTEPQSAGTRHPQCTIALCQWTHVLCTALSRGQSYSRDYLQALQYTILAAEVGRARGCLDIN
jgi:hypothetical protein